MADFQLVQQLDPATGQSIFDFVFTPAGDFATISGPSLVAQNVLLYLLTGQGTDPTNPLFGSTLQGSIGQPFTDPALLQLALAQCVSYYQGVQAQRPTPLDEQLTSIDTVTIVPTALGQYKMSFVVHVASGAAQAVTF